MELIKVCLQEHVEGKCRNKFLHMKKMKSISIDFKNAIICIISDGQQGTEHADDSIRKIKFHSFIPQEYRENDSFTWNFEDETFAVNKKFDLKSGSIMSADDFVPERIVTMPGLRDRYEEFIAIMGFEEFETMDIMDDLIKSLLGF